MPASDSLRAGDAPFLWLTAVSAVGLAVLRAASMDGITRWWILAFEIAVLLRAALPTRRWSPDRTRLLVALGFCLVGDLLINWTPWGDGCIAAFAIAHFHLLWIFVGLRRIRRVEAPLLLPGMGSSAVVFAVVVPVLDKAWMPFLLAAYLLLLDLVLWRALALLRAPRAAGARWFAAGAALFFATDHLVILQIYRPATAWVVATWICYLPALALLAVAARFLEGTEPSVPEA